MTADEFERQYAESERDDCGAAPRTRQNRGALRLWRRRLRRDERISFEPIVRDIVPIAA